MLANLFLLEDNILYRYKTNKVCFLFVFSVYPDHYYGLYGNPWLGWPYHFAWARGYPYFFNHGYNGVATFHYNKVSADQVAPAGAAEPASVPVPAPQ